MAVTDSGVLAGSGPIVAEIVVEPSDTPVISPVVGPTVATDGVLDAHTAMVVTLAVVASEYVPVATS